MKSLGAFVLGAIVGYLLALILRQHSTPETPDDDYPVMLHDPHLEAPFTTIWERAA